MAVEAVRKALRHRTTNTTEQYCARVRTNDAFADVHRAFAKRSSKPNPLNLKRKSVWFKSRRVH